MILAILTLLVFSFIANSSATISFLISIPILLILIAITDFLVNVHEYRKSINIVNKNTYIRKENIISVDDIHHLTPREFELWVGKILKIIGYSDIQVTNLGPDGGKDIICKFGDLTTYVECKRYLDNDSKALYKVDDEIVKKLVGAMIGDNVTNGIICTTGVVTEDAIKFIESLTGDITIEIVDGKSLAQIYNEAVNPSFKYVGLYGN